MFRVLSATADFLCHSDQAQRVEGSDGSAAGGGVSDLSEWQRSKFCERIASRKFWVPQQDSSKNSQCYRRTEIPRQRANALLGMTGRFTYYYVTNLQGDVVALLNSSGAEVVRYVYDKETKLYYLQSRYYNPKWGRFITADDVDYLGADGTPLSYNLFAYCKNNPVKNVDITGHYPLEAAFVFLETWLNGNGSIQNYTVKSRIVKKLKKSKKMQSYVGKAIDNYKAGQSITSGYGEFTAAEDGYELYLSTQHFSYTVTIAEESRTTDFWWWKHTEARYTATVVVHDIYNFDKLREWNSFGNVMNNIAFLYNALGGGRDYEWFATYKYSTKWKTVS